MTNCNNSKNLNKKSKRKFYILVILVLGLLALSYINLWLSLITVVCLWLIHSAYLSDHIFYNPRTDYCYNLAGDKFSTNLKQGKLIVSPNLTANLTNSTVLWQVSIKANLLGYLFDPYLKLGSDKQYFERGLKGVRFINLSSQNLQNLTVKACFCKIMKTGNLYVSSNPDFSDKHIMVIAPHPDDAEIAAYGLYSKHSNASIITISQGEVEADYYQRKFKLAKNKASKLKGLLRSFDSVSASIWSKVKMQNCVQLGYFCLSYLHS